MKNKVKQIADEFIENTFSPLRPDWKIVIQLAFYSGMAIALQQAKRISKKDNSGNELKSFIDAINELGLALKPKK